MMGMPFQPEPLETLKARFAAAMSEIFDVESIRLGVAARPGQLRRQTFDFESGIRIIASRDRCPHGEVYRAFSASIKDECELVRQVRDLPPPVQLLQLTQAVLVAWKNLTGDAVEPAPNVFIANGVLRWTTEDR